MPASEPLAKGQIRRTALGSQATPAAPGWETRLYLIEYGPGATAPLHVHPFVGIGYVLEGSFESAFGDESPHVIHAGEQFVDPPAVPHRLFKNVSDTAPLRFVIAYTMRADREIFYPGAKLPDGG